jgi:hypothetical protein
MRRYLGSAFIVFSIFFLLISHFIYPSYWTEWIEYPSNPVLDPGDPGIRAYYPSVSYDPEAFSGNGTPAYYKMWFAQGKSVGYAWSDDGISWVEHNNSLPLPGILNGASHPVVVYSSDGFGSGLYFYKIWYWYPPASYSSISAIRHAQSVDGINWVNDQPITQHPTDPYLQLIDGNFGSYFFHNYGPGCVIYNPSGTDVGSTTPDDKSDDDPMSYHYVMYYDSSGEGNSPNGSVEQTSLAYSVDGIYWIRYGDEPVVIPSGDETDWDGKYSFRASVLKVDDTYHMWFAGADGNPLSMGTYYAQGIGYASSADGLNWTKDPDNPVMHVSDGLDWRNVRTYTPMVLYDPDLFSGHGDSYIFKMWFNGRENDPTNYTVGYAGLPPIPQNPLKACFKATPGMGNAPLIVQFDASCVNDTNGDVILYYWDFGDGHTGKGLKVSHTYTTIGDFAVTLTIHTKDGPIDSTVQNSTVFSPIQACVNCMHSTGFSPFTIELDASCTLSLTKKEIISYQWFLGNGDEADGMKLTYTYHDPGEYRIQVLATDENGYSDSADCIKVIVKKVFPPKYIELIRELNRSLFRKEAFHTIRWTNDPRNCCLVLSGYRVYRKLSHQPEDHFQLIGSVNTHQLEFRDIMLNISTKYTYRVTAVEDGGHESSPSTTVTHDIEEN